jgi:hypothetical protein
MKRVEIGYQGSSYTLPDTTAQHVRRTIEHGLAEGRPFWLRVNFGEGKPQPVDLLLGTGVGITVADLNVDETTGETLDVATMSDDLGEIIPFDAE